MDNQNKSDMVIYNGSELELNVSVTGDTLWLIQIQLCDIFEKTKVSSVGISIIFSETMKWMKKAICKKYILQILINL